ncbi:FISUMP domain-containing protein [Elizabethkingia meningoseptica]|uniref:FISUMP domain-containing protein n=1 Tax=Elizabethkingia meningoseptica TaxID=238 RepID=UPI00301AF439
MKIRKEITSISFNCLIILGFIYCYSCRSAEHDHIVAGGGIAAVKINLLGAEYANSDKPTQVASINQKGLSIDNDVQHYSILVSPSSFISAELAPATTLNTVASTSKNFNTMAAVPGNPIGTGVKFRAIAYRQGDGSYQTYQDYTIGQSAQPMMLNGGEKYDIIVYSYGVNTLPTISANEQTNISSAKINYDNDNRDLMYQKISDFRPDGNSNDNTLNIKLRHKIPNLTVTLKSTSVINSVSNALIGNNYANAKLSLQSGVMTDWGSSNKVNVEFPSSSSNSLISSPVFVNNDTDKGLFSAEITVAGLKKNIDLVNAFKITPEYKSSLTINLLNCGAYIAPGVWKSFSCHNLGADTSADPFTPVAAIHGAKYQWGSQTGESGRYISQLDDQNNSGAIAGWNAISLSGNPWNSGTSGNPIKTSKDPCPSGYRVPTENEFKAILNNNSKSYVGNNWFDSATNFSTGIMIGNNLFLPAPGLRYISNGSLNGRGFGGYYWNSNNDDNSLNTLQITNQSAYMTSLNKVFGASIRCIAE